jgi:hypothetical protein
VRTLVVGELVAQHAELVGLPEFADDVIEGRAADEVACRGAAIASPAARCVFPTPGGPSIRDETLFCSPEYPSALADCFATAAELGPDDGDEWVPPLVIRRVRRSLLVKGPLASEPAGSSSAFALESRSVWAACSTSSRHLRFAWD